MIFSVSPRLEALFDKTRIYAAMACHGMEGNHAITKWPEGSPTFSSGGYDYWDISLDGEPYVLVIYHNRYGIYKGEAGPLKDNMDFLSLSHKEIAGNDIDMTVHPWKGNRALVDRLEDIFAQPALAECTLLGMTGFVEGSLMGVDWFDAVATIYLQAIDGAFKSYNLFLTEMGLVMAEPVLGNDFVKVAKSLFKGNPPANKNERWGNMFRYKEVAEEMRLKKAQFLAAHASPAQLMSQFENCETENLDAMIEGSKVPVLGIRDIGYHPEGAHPGEAFQPLFSVFLGESHGLGILPERCIVSMWSNKDLLADEPFVMMNARNDFRIFLLPCGAGVREARNQDEFAVFKGDYVRHHLDYGDFVNLFPDLAQDIVETTTGLVPPEFSNNFDIRPLPGCICGNYICNGHVKENIKWLIGGQGFYEQYPEWPDAKLYMETSNLCVLTSFKFDDFEMGAYMISLVVDEDKLKRGVLEDAYVHIEYW